MDFAESQETHPSIAGEGMLHKSTYVITIILYVSRVGVTRSTRIIDSHQGSIHYMRVDSEPSHADDHIFLLTKSETGYLYSKLYKLSNSFRSTRLETHVYPGPVLKMIRGPPEKLSQVCLTVS